MSIAVGDRVRVKDGYADERGDGVKPGDEGEVQRVAAPNGIGVVDVEFEGGGYWVPILSDWLDVID